MQVKIYQLAEQADELLEFAVIIAKYHDTYIFVQHKNRASLEIPGGHREPGESIRDCAKRELQEETGATHFSITPLFIYGVQKEGLTEDFGLVFLAEINALTADLQFEIAQVHFLKTPPTHWTYPQIQPILWEHFLIAETTDTL